MKIAIADNCHLKFSRDIKEHWEAAGHEVKYEPGASEHLAQWADLYYCDFSDNNIHYLRDLYVDDPRKCRTPNWDNKKRPKFVVRAIDWDIWIGYARNQDLVEFVDQWICISRHTEKKLRSEANYSPASKLKLIRPGVNLDRFTLKTKTTNGFNLGMALGDMWWYKNHMGGLDIFKTLYDQDHRWRLHIRGQHEAGEYNIAMYEHYLQSRGIRDCVILYPSVEDMNEWYENIDILLHPGMKEAYCYAVGEALAKGIPTVVNEFLGSEDIWDVEMLYKTHEEAVKKITNQKFQFTAVKESRREYIKNDHNVKTMLAEYDKLLGT